MAEATPGPWRIGAGGFPHEGNIYGEGHIVASIGDNFPDAEGNRRLIAQAPALRDSLEEMLNAAHEMELPSEEVRTRAMQVFLAAKGV